MQKFNKKLFILSLLIVVIGTCLYRFPSDDGLRHIGMAFGDFESWGDVYPFSQFEAFRDYDPWFGYDLTLRAIAAGLQWISLPPFLSRFLLAKVVLLLFSMVFFYLVLQRSGILEEIKDRDTFTLAGIIIFVFLVLSFLRITIIRPFAFGSFFLLYAVGQKGVVRGALSSGILMFFYPYLAWFYTIPVAFAHFVKGDKRFAAGAVSLTLLFLYFQPLSFWGFQVALFKSDLVRNVLNTKIGEFNSTFNNLPFYIYLSLFLILFPLFSGEVKKLNIRNILILIYLIPVLKYIRYFLDLTLPLLFVSFGREMLKVLIEPYRKLVSYWANAFSRALQRLKLPKMMETAGSANIKPYLAIGYVFVFALLVHQSYENFTTFKKFRDDLSIIPTGSLVLSDFNLQYKILYLRPDLCVIPSCEMGFPARGIKKEYIEFMNKGKVAALARKTGAEFFLENRHMYVDPEDGKFLKLMGKSDKLRVWKIEQGKQ
ncbi:MAG: hypothetical protein B1H13_05090 [Desulfobacteraceae bacterium 4484_190.3]|nr:MAG: hypothetical protein B1H13_05090 [Desulfobacteraceae bacterium 4484_190.3]